MDEGTPEEEERKGELLFQQLVAAFPRMGND